MATAVLEIAGRRYEIACRDGEEARLEALGRTVADRADAATAGMGNVNEARRLLFAALLLADEAAPRTSVPPPDPELPKLLDALADHLEGLAGRLEKDAPAS